MIYSCFQQQGQKNKDDLTGELAEKEKSSMSSAESELKISKIDDVRERLSALQVRRELTSLKCFSYLFVNENLRNFLCNVHSRNGPDINQ